MDNEIFKDYVENRYRDQMSYYSKAAGKNQKKVQTISMDPDHLFSYYTCSCCIGWKMGELTDTRRINFRRGRSSYCWS